MSAAGAVTEERAREGARNALSHDGEAEHIREATARLIDEMQEATREANIIQGEPIYPLLGSLQRAVAWMGELTARHAQAATEQSVNIGRTVADVRRVADAEIERERAALSVDKARIVRELSSAIAESTIRAQASRARTLNAKALSVAAAVNTGVFLLVAGLGYAFGLEQGTRQVHVTEAGLSAAFQHGSLAADQWRGLMNSNNPTQMLAGCHGAALETFSGRRACEVPLWLDPPSTSAPPVGR